MKTIWISDEVLNWTGQAETGTYLDLRDRQRSYDHLARAEYFVASQSSPSAADRADCISNLRKCVTHRLQLFEQVYNLRAVMDAGKKRPYLSVLAEFKLVRPFLMERLLTVRNAIEYRDIAPPSAARCREFIDVIWYFLRSTDSLLSIRRTGFILESAGSDDIESPYWMSNDLSYRPRFKVEARGWLPFEFVVNSSKDSTIQFRGEIGTRGERWTKENTQISAPKISGSTGGFSYSLSRPFES